MDSKPAFERIVLWISGPISELSKLIASIIEPGPNGIYVTFTLTTLPRGIKAKHTYDVTIHGYGDPSNPVDVEYFNTQSEKIKSALKQR